MVTPDPTGPEPAPGCGMSHTLGELFADLAYCAFNGESLGPRLRELASATDGIRLPAALEDAPCACEHAAAPETPTASGGLLVRTITDGEGPF